MTLAVVQSKFQNNGNLVNTQQTITMSSSLTAGNKLYLFAYGQINSGSIDTSAYTIESTNGPGGGTATQYLLSRTVQGGDGTAPPGFTSAGTSNTTFRVIGVEVSGGAKVEAVVQNTSTSSPISGPTTANNNDLGLLASGGGSGFGSYTPATGWTNDQADTGGSTTLDHIAVPTSGTSLTASPSWSVGGTTGHWMNVALQIDAGVLVNLTGVSATGAAGNLSETVDVSPALVQVSAAGHAGSLAADFDSNVNLVQVAAVGAVGALTLDLDVTLAGVAAIGKAGDFQHTEAYLVGVSAGCGFVPIGVEIAPPYCPMAIFSIMRDSPVACVGAMSAGPVTCIGKLCVDSPEPASLQFSLTGVASIARASTITPFFNVNTPLTGVSAGTHAGNIIAV